MDVGQRTASLFQEEIDNGGVVRKQAELFAQGSCGVADVDADKAVVRQNNGFLYVKLPDFVIVNYNRIFKKA